MPATKWDGSDDEFWSAIAVASDPDAGEEASIAAAVLLHEILLTAQDAITRPQSRDSQTIAIPQRVIAKPKPGEVVTVDRAVELFADRWVLRPVSPDPESALSEVRDYRVHDAQLEYNTSYPPVWETSAGTISDCPQWRVITQQKEIAAVPIVQPRSSRK